jgi:hypothetical protein
LFAYTGLFVWMLRLKIRVLAIEGLREPKFVNRKSDRG